jgi:hypothetical protein
VFISNATPESTHSLILGQHLLCGGQTHLGHPRSPRMVDRFSRRCLESSLIALGL